MYLGAVCEGLDMVLAEYRDTLTRLEKEMMYEGDTLPLSLVQHQLSPHRPVLRYLVKLVTQLGRERPPGVMILDRVYKASTTGVAAVGAGLRLVLAEGHKVRQFQHRHDDDHDDNDDDYIDDDHDVGDDDVDDNL